MLEFDGGKLRARAGERGDRQLEPRPVADEGRRVTRSDLDMGDLDVRRRQQANLKRAGNAQFDAEAPGELCLDPRALGGPVDERRRNQRRS